MADQVSNEDETNKGSPYTKFQIFKDVAPLFGPWIAVMALIVVIASGAIHFKSTRQHEIAVANFEQWMDDVVHGTERGSDIGMAELFSSARHGLAVLARLYSVGSDSTNPTRSEIERAGVLFKLPILKKALVCDVQRRNYNYRILELNDKVEFSKANTVLNHTTTFIGQYNKYTSTDNYRFKVFIEPGMSLTRINECNFTVKIEKDGVSKTLNEHEYNISHLGSRDVPSPLWEITIPVSTVKDGDIVKVTVIQHDITQRSGAIPFSIYDVHTERYALGIEKIGTSISFDEKMKLIGLSFEMDQLKDSVMNVDDFNISFPSGYKWGMETQRFDFEMINPERPFAIAFYRFYTPDKEL